MIGAAAAICLALAGHVTRVPTAAFTLSWFHSVQKTEWQEDYQVDGDRLVLVEARIQGSGAGMDPPPDAVRRGKWWAYTPHLPPLPELRLTLSPYTGDYSLCHDGRCAPLARLAGAKRPDGVVSIQPCS